MTETERVIDSIRKEVESGGRSGSQTIYMDNVSFRVSANVGPLTSLGVNYGQVVNDFEWFLICEDLQDHTSHPQPSNSWWLKQFGEDAYAYGETWNLPIIIANLQNHVQHRRAVLMNPHGSCIVCYQFMHGDYGCLDVTATLRSSDVVNCLPQDVLMTDLLLSHVAKEIGLEPGKLTFNIGNAHVFYDDLEWQEEFTFDVSN